MTYHLHQIPLFTTLDKAQNILLAGAGGGFDIYSGLPLYFALRQMGKNVHLANLSFTFLAGTDAEQINEVTWKVTAKHSGASYFPEKYLCEWLESVGEQVAIYSFAKAGVVPLRDAYQQLIDTLNLDAVVLVDGGTDSLMRGDEAGLGTPTEDIASMGAVFQAKVAQKLLVCLGFGVDDFHGVPHAQFLENVARLSQKKAFLGCFSLTPGMSEANALRDATQYANEKMAFQPSIVANSIVSALEGHYGDHHATFRTSGSRLWINPLMYIYWGFQLEPVIDELLYYELIRNTENIDEINNLIMLFRSRITPKLKENIPL